MCRRREKVFGAMAVPEKSAAGSVRLLERWLSRKMCRRRSKAFGAVAVPKEPCRRRSKVFGVVVDPKKSAAGSARLLERWLFRKNRAAGATRLLERWLSRRNVPQALKICTAEILTRVVWLTSACTVLRARRPKE